MEISLPRATKTLFQFWAEDDLRLPIPTLLTSSLNQLHTEIEETVWDLSVEDSETKQVWVGGQIVGRDEHQHSSHP